MLNSFQKIRTNIFKHVYFSKEIFKNPVWFLHSARSGFVSCSGLKLIINSYTIHQYLSLHNRVDEKYMRAISKDSLCLLAIQKGGVFFLKYEQALCYLKAVNIWLPYRTRLLHDMIRYLYVLKSNPIKINPFLLPMAITAWTKV